LTFFYSSDMPNYIKTQPPQKFFKVDWDLGILR